MIHPGSGALLKGIYDDDFLSKDHTLHFATILMKKWAFDNFELLFSSLVTLKLVSHGKK